MNLQLVVPLTRKTPVRVAGLVLLTLGCIALMYLVVGLAGAVILAAELFLLGRLLLIAARGE